MSEQFLGQTLGERYHLTRLLGVGAYAWVYEAVDTELEIVVAVKVLRPELRGNEIAEARFRREATTAARLRHPNIVTVRDVGRDENATWVAMDLVATTLGRRLQVMPHLPEPEVVRLGLDVASALAAAHADNVLHRDIKPDNILVGAAGEAIVCDFGLARAVIGGADLSAANQVLGTPHYFSPEQARGEPLDGRSDLYALGITLYRSATGRLPFEGDDWYQVARQHVDASPTPPRDIVSTISPELEAVILRLLAKRPEDRYATAGALADALSKLPSALLLSGRTNATVGGTTAVHTIPPRKRSAWRWFWPVAATAVVAVLTAWGVRGQHPFLARVAAILSAADSQLVTPAATESTLLSLDPLAIDSSRPADSLRPTPLALPAPVSPGLRRTGAIDVVSTDTVVLRINGEDVGRAPWQGSRLAPGRYIIGAALFGGPGVANCPFAEGTDTLTLSAGEKLQHEVSLSRCSVVLLVVTPADSRIAFSDSDGRMMHQGAVDRLSPLIMRAGVWRVHAEARACASYDGVDTLRAGSDTVRITMLCSN